MLSVANPLYFFTSSVEAPTPLSRLRIADVMDFFFVVHPDSGRKEGDEHKRIMYFNPKVEALDKQTEITGFAEALQFLREIEEEFDFRTVSTQKSDHVYIQVEKQKFILGISLSKQMAFHSNYPLYLPAVKKTSSVIPTRLFRLFFSAIFGSFRENDEEKFKERLELFFSRFLPLLKVQRLPILDQLGGVEFFYHFPGKLLYYSISKQDLPVLFRYLTQNLLPTAIAPELEPTRAANKGRFFYRNPDDVELDDEEELLERYQMIVYRCLNATVCMFVRFPDVETSSKEQIVSRRMLRNIDAYLETDLSNLASRIGDEIGGENDLRPEATDFHYVYFNPASLSMTSSFSSTSSEGLDGTTASVGVAKAPPPPVDVNRLVCETLSGFVSESEEFGECFAKSETDWWVVIKKVNSRLLVLLLPPSSYQQSLADVQSRTQVIVKSHFKAIFFN
ncbi:unnamed protein product [Caenorhabditis auriculariae]|uniref:CCZ1/INTU/HSP4 first Longin domain-containing protein n=1 Tax=Caenorhabditis auriculariae TaxID=2777116 RepID=A0A8S1H3X0_9PELO|nr:unnamed protein product [Caenorhabditis auriculariae]